MNLAAALAGSCAQLLWPAHCAGCDTILASDKVVFCGCCATTLNPLVSSCPGCGLPKSAADAAANAAPGWAPWPARTRCAECARHRFVFSRADAGFEYGAALAAAIVRMKHGGRRDLVPGLGRLFRETFSQAASGGGAMLPVNGVLPVPLHPRKLRRRGFNQALELARAALAALRPGTPGRPSPPWPALERRLLVRTRHTAELGRSGPALRRREVEGAFAVSDPDRVRGRRFLVVDDVMTSGATLNECAKTLRAAGAAEVRVAALARAVP